MQVPFHRPITSPLVTPPASAAVRKMVSSAANPASSSSGSSSDSSTSGASITANDFLELLVTEMKNQDPTSDTDPNEYIDQLVQVNSLEQLIQINQDLGGDAGTSSASASAASVSRGNLSPNISDHSNLTMAAGQVADALERRQPNSTTHPASQSEERLPFPLPGENSVKP